MQDMDTPRMHALIPCAGTGSRSGASIPKQYVAVAGQPMLWHTVAAFDACMQIDAILLVLAPDDAHGDTVPLPAGKLQRARVGGNSRAESVHNGLRHLRAQGVPEHDWVLVHDAARCLLTPTQINQLITACAEDAVGGLLALPLPDTLKQQDEAARVQATIPRSDKWLAQTPQMFRLGLLLQALEDSLQHTPDAITDESSAIELAGLQPQLVQGSAWNFKVTYPDDFALAEAVLQARAAASHGTIQP